MSISPLKVLFAAALMLALPCSRLQAAGEVDPSFQAPFDTTASTGVIAFQPDGKFLAAGTFSLNNSSYVNLVRLLPDGSLDSSFNPGNQAYLGPCSVAVQPDGKIVMGGNSRLVRLNPDGTKDPTFNAVINNGQALAVVRQPDGKLIVGGTFGMVNDQAHAGLARFNPDGTLDTSFGVGTVTNGTVLFLGIQTDGHIIVAGQFTQIKGVPRTGLARLSPNGDVDDVVFDPGSFHFNYLNSILLLPDGKILLDGGEFAGSGPQYLVRFLPDGTLDPAFPPIAHFKAGILAGQLDGNVIASEGLMLKRISDTGTIEDSSTFDPVGGAQSGTFIVPSLQPDGKILVSGDFDQFAGTARPALARLANGPTTQQLTVPDLTRVQWQRSGTGPLLSYVYLEVSTDRGASWSALGLADPVAGGWEKTGLTLPAGGQLRARGYAATGDRGTGLIEQVTDYDLATAPPDLTTVTSVLAPRRLMKVQFTLPESAKPSSVELKFDDGNSTQTFVLKPQFENAGTYEFRFDPRNPAPTLFHEPIAAIPDGEYLVTLSYADRVNHPAAESDSQEVTIASDALPGVLLPQYDLEVAGSHPPTYVAAAANQPDGSTIIVGNFTSVGGATRNRIARLSGDGVLDSTFDPNANGNINCVAILPDGRLLIAGEFSTIGGQPHQSVARLNPDGTPDSTFNPALDAIGVYSIAVQPDGKILIGTAGLGIGDGHLKRLSADGVVEPNFDLLLGTLVRSIVIETDGRIICGGAFDGTTNLRRVNLDGTLDDHYRPVFGAVYNIALQTDGKLVAAGTSGIQRFNPDGTADSGFTKPVADAYVYCTSLQADGKIVIGGEFTTLNGEPCNRIARLNADGSIDPDFFATTNGIVYCTSFQSYGSIVIGGSFSTVNGEDRTLIALLANDEATNDLSAVSSTEVQWSRGGAAPEIDRATLEFSYDGISWTPLGSGERSGTGWKFTTPNFGGLSGQLRAQGWAASGSFGSSSAIVETSGAFDFDSVDGFTIAPTLTKPESNSLTHLGLEIDLTLPEAATPGSVTLTFKNADDVTAPEIVLTISNHDARGPHTFEVMTTDLASSEDFSTPAPAIPDGRYTVTLAYQDDSGHDPATAVANSVKIDNTGPALDLTLRTIALDEAGEATVPDLSAIASDPNGISDFTQNPESGEPLSVGDQFVAVTATDAAGNTSSGNLLISVFYERPTEVVAKPLVRTTETLPNLPTFGAAAPAGTALASLSTPAISDNRTMVAKGTLLNGRKKLACLYAEDQAGTAGLVAFQGSPAPGISGATFKSFLDPQISPDGRTIVFAGKVGGGGSKAGTDDGVWLIPLASPVTDAQLLLREGEDVPGLPVGTKLKAITGLSLRDDGVVALVQLARKAGLVTAADDTALVFLSAAQADALLIRENDDFPDSSSPETTVKSITVLSPALASPGHGRWHTNGLIAAKLTLADKRMALVQFENATTRSILALTGDSTGFPDSSTWNSFGLPSQCGVPGEIIATGTIAPLAGAVTKSNDTAIGTSWNGTFTGVQREGETTPIDGLTWASFYDPVMNDFGRSAFLATVKGVGVTAANKTTLWWNDASDPLLLARTNDPESPVPDRTGAAVDGRLWSGITAYALPYGESSAPVFIAKVKGSGIKTNSNIGLYAVDSTGQLRELLRTNDPIDFGSPIGSKTVKSFTLLNATPGSYGVGRSYNTNGALAVLVTLNDKSQALLRVEIP